MRAGLLLAAHVHEAHPIAILRLPIARVLIDDFQIGRGGLFVATPLIVEIAFGAGDSVGGTSVVYARRDTPVHSLLHEACHLIVLPPERRALVHTDASDCTQEEDATCYLQVLLADALPGVGRERVMRDMDEWGYSFRLGSTRAWFERDADDARAWLASRGLPGTIRLYGTPAEESASRNAVRANVYRQRNE